jgi:hypothetical protein
MLLVLTMKLASFFLILSISAASHAQNLFSISVTPTVTDVNKLAGLFFITTPEQGYVAAAPLGLDAKVGQTTTAEFNTNFDTNAIRYAVLGSYGISGVTLGVDKDAANELVGRGWNDVFTNPAFSEANVRTAIDTEDVLTQLLFSQYVASIRVSVNGVNRDLFTNLSSDVALVNFSIGSRNGSARITPVPEPATMAALGVGVLAMVRRRRSR